VTRRELLCLAASGFVGGRGLRASEPQNLSYPLRTIEGTQTPPSLLFVRDHFSEPEVSLESWKLRIEGRVERPYEVGFADLVELPSRKVEAVLECAGNLAGGSAVSSGVWEGVPISALLEAAKPASGAAFLLLEGSDSGRLFGDSPALPYSQLVPVAKCLDASSLVAFQYNGLSLPKRNGFPARAIFPGWYGMNSVKWLRRVTVLGESDRETIFHQSGMSRLYNRITRQQGVEQVKRVSAIEVKSVVAWPGNGLRLPAGHHVVWGFAWSGEDPVREVLMSSDGGKGWRPARMESKPEDYGWTRWSYGWTARPGEYILMSRATDRSGKRQPIERDPSRKDAYELNWCMPIHCSVR
jgi:DMSO/TMAO reductase YedYZ molybdopterin-dependent catalytic subunit